MGRNADAPAAGGDGTISSLYPADTRSYYEQFQSLKGSKDLSIIHKAYPKPSLAAQRAAPTAHSVPVSDVVTCDVDRPLLAAQPKTLTPEEVEAVQQYSFFWRRVGFVVVSLAGRRAAAAAVTRACLPGWATRAQQHAGQHRTTRQPLSAAAALPLPTPRCTPSCSR